MPADIGVWTVDGGRPVRLLPGGVELERNLEDWIEAAPSLLADGLRIVGRQIHLDGGPLDLLGVDSQERWVVVELKRDRLHRETLTQALDYASSIATLPAGELREKLAPQLVDTPAMAALIDRTLDGEGQDG